MNSVPIPSATFHGSSLRGERLLISGETLAAAKLGSSLRAAGFTVIDAADARLMTDVSAIIIEAQSGRPVDVPRRADSEAVIALVPEPEIGRTAQISGYDDFLLTTASASEALVRVESAIAHRRRHDDPTASQIVETGAIRIDVERYEAWVAGDPIDLTHKEFDLLLYLARRNGRVVTREELLRRVWGFDVFVGARTVDVHIRRLRLKIDDARHGLIETVRGVGYRLGGGWRPSEGANA